MLLRCANKEWMRMQLPGCEKKGLTIIPKKFNNLCICSYSQWVLLYIGICNRNMHGFRVINITLKLNSWRRSQNKHRFDADFSAERDRLIYWWRIRPTTPSQLLQSTISLHDYESFWDNQQPMWTILSKRCINFLVLPLWRTLGKV